MAFLTNFICNYKRYYWISFIIGIMIISLIMHFIKDENNILFCGFLVIHLIIVKFLYRQECILLDIKNKDEEIKLRNELIRKSIIT